MKPGLRIAGKYELLRQIGVGGMGEVWAAYHARIDRHVAIKFPAVDLANRPEIRERFLAEARILGRLRHPNIVDVIDFGEFDDDGLFLVFELLDGVSLDAYVQELGRLASHNAVQIVIELCRGLAFAHEVNVIHRDLKPANVFLHNAPGGRTQVKLLDFGISKICALEVGPPSLTDAGAVLGTPAYMSYEQAKALPNIDARSDIWNVGAILYEMLAGLPPFEAPTYSSVIAKIVSEPVPPLSTWGAVVAPELEAIVMRCLEKDRDLRFPSATAVQDALQRLLPRLSEPPASRRLQLDSLTDLPTIPPPPIFDPPSIPSSSLRLYSPWEMSLNAVSESPRAEQNSQITPTPSLQSIPAPTQNKPRTVQLALGALALSGIIAGATILASYGVSPRTPSTGTITTPPEDFPEQRLPLSQDLSADTHPEALPPAVDSSTAEPQSPPFTVHSQAPGPTRPRPPVKPRSDPKSEPGAKKPPATLVDDPGF